MELYIVGNGFDIAYGIAHACRTVFNSFSKRVQKQIMKES